MKRPVLAAFAATAVVGGLAIAAPAAAADTDIRINEVQSDSAIGAPDFVELINIGTESVDISGWVLRDDNDARDLRVAAGTVLEPGELFVIEPDQDPDFGFGLGSNDMARIYAADGTTLIDSYEWTDHAFSEGRVPDGTGDFVDTEPTPGAPNVVRQDDGFYDADETIVVNEVMSDDPDGGADWVELFNTGDAGVDVSDWVLRDDNDLRDLRIAEGTVIAPGAFLVIETDTPADGFGLGRADEIRVFLDDGLGLVDGHSWTDHVASEGRVPDGSGAFVGTEPTPGSANVARDNGFSVVINEVETNGDPRGDWVELANTDQEQTADVSGWTLVDDDPTHDPIVLPEGTTIESGGYLGVLTEPHFGLGSPDSVTVRDASGTVVASLAWTAHSPTTIGRCPDMTGPFTDTGGGTFELVNDCSGLVDPDVDVEPWPFENEVRDAVAPGTWGDDMSGIDVAPDGTVYAVNNGNGEIFRLAGGPETFTVAESWLPTYPDGGGQPDGEGITVGDDGAVYLATERDNRASSVSRPSVLRVELGANGESTTTHEWNLAEITGALGANGGLEGLEWISDADATRLGVRGLDGEVYDPATYGDHTGGIFAAGVEQTGNIHLVVLEEDGGITELQTVAPSEAVSSVMALDWRAGANELWALCDEVCDNRAAVFAFDDGELTRQVEYAAPTGMNTAYTNEGFAMVWCDVNADVWPTVMWMSDTPHEGVSLRVADGGECVEPEEPGEGPDDDATPAPVPDDDLDGADRGDVTVPATARPGETITVTVPSAAGQEVSIWLHSTPALLTTDAVAADGTIPATIPVDAAVGPHRIVVQAADGSLIGWAPIEIVAVDAPGELPATGGELSPWLAMMAIGLVLAGAALAVRRRRATTE